MEISENREPNPDLFEYNLNQMSTAQQKLDIGLLTNEEERVSIYGDSHSPTVASEVNSKTPLEDLNLNWTERDLREKERTKHVHRLHPYLGKFIPQLVEIFLRKYFEPSQTVIDPFCGSGTTLVQANELGINSIGYDVSAFNVLLCAVKTGSYDVRRLRSEVLDVLAKVQRITQRDVDSPHLWAHEHTVDLKEASGYLNKWFAPSALNELLTYRALLDSYHYRDVLKIILARAARSSRLTTHFDLDFPKKPQTDSYYCYKHSRRCSPTTDAFQFLRRYSFDTIKRLEEFSRKRTDASVSVYHQDSRHAEFPPFDGVITSPPYVGLIDYHEQHAYAYHLLGLEDQRTKEIGPASAGSSQKAKAKYQQDISEVFRRLSSFVRNGGRLIVIAGDRANLYPEIAAMAGLQTEAIIKRHVNRRTGRRSTNFFESVFIWRKP